MDIEKDINYHNLTSPEFISTEIIRDLQKSNRIKDIMIFSLSIIIILFMTVVSYFLINYNVSVTHHTDTVDVGGDYNRFQDNSIQNINNGGD